MRRAGVATGLTLLSGVLLAGGASTAPAGGRPPQAAATPAPATPAGVPRVAERDMLLADLPAATDVVLSGATPPETGALLQAVFEAGPGYRFDEGGLTATTDARWFAARPVDGPGAPLLELRRWPGDSVLSLWRLAPGSPTEAPSVQIPGVPSLVRLGPAGARGAAWRGILEGEDGDRSVEWIERSFGPEDARLGALLVPGDAGWGAAGIESLAAELRAVVERVSVDPVVWNREARLAAGAPLRLPILSAPPGDATEKSDPWQIVVGKDFTLGLPPGMRARPVEESVPAPRPLAGQRLWLRGRLVDREGQPVVVGDGRRAGYVAEVTAGLDAWFARHRPLGVAEGAAAHAREDFPFLAEQSEASAARAERWREPGFAGDWLIFRLRFADRGVEIGLPVLAGRQSPALFWIPATWRGAGKAPAPPPVDPADQFDIRYDRLMPSERKHEPWIEGRLEVPGLQLSLPHGWWPAVTLRSRDGYPIRIVAASGSGTVAQLLRVPADALPSAETPAGWTAHPSPRIHAAERAWQRADGALLVEDPAGGGFLLEPGTGRRDDEHYGPHWQVLTESLRLVRSERPRP